MHPIRRSSSRESSPTGRLWRCTSPNPFRGLRTAYRAQRTLGMVLGGDVAFELGDEVALLGDHRLHHVADRDQPHQVLPVVEHRKVPHSPVRHHLHALGDRRRR